MAAERPSSRASRAECGGGASESPSYSFWGEGEEEACRIGGGGGLPLRRLVILAGLASIVALAASARGSRSNELMSSFPDPDERPHASKGSLRPKQDHPTYPFHASILRTAHNATPTQTQTHTRRRRHVHVHTHSNVPPMQHKKHWRASHGLSSFLFQQLLTEDRSPRWCRTSIPSKGDSD